jgi:hypothetical protein
VDQRAQSGHVGDVVFWRASGEVLTKMKLSVCLAKNEATEYILRCGDWFGEYWEYFIAKRIISPELGYVSGVV